MYFEDIEIDVLRYRFGEWLMANLIVYSPLTSGGWGPLTGCDICQRVLEIRTMSKALSNGFHLHRLL